MIVEALLDGQSAGDLVEWLWEETHVQNVVGSNPSTVYWLDIFTNICCKIVMFV